MCVCVYVYGDIKVSCVLRAGASHSNSARQALLSPLKRVGSQSPEGSVACLHKITQVINDGDRIFIPPAMLPAGTSASYPGRQIPVEPRQIARPVLKTRRSTFKL